MRKLLVVSIACAVLLGVVGVVSAADAPADGLKMNKTAKTVVLNHSTHAKIDCVTCHHKWDGKGPIGGCSDAGCHDKMDKADKTANSYYQAMHNKKAAKPTCVSCHTEEAAKMDPEKGKAMKGCAKSVCHP